jgi:hypothetical protein
LRNKFREGERWGSLPIYSAFEDGPRVEIKVFRGGGPSSASAPESEVRRPKVCRGVGLIDTGAVRTIIDRRIARRLKLPEISVMPMQSAGHKETQHCDVYAIQIIIPKFTSFGPPIELEVPAMDLHLDGIDCLLGLDILSQFTMFADGPRQSFLLNRFVG